MFPHSCLRLIPGLARPNNPQVRAVPECFLRATAEAMSPVSAGSPGVSSDPGPLQDTPLTPQPARQSHAVLDPARPPVRGLQPVLELLGLQLRQLYGVDDAARGDGVGGGDLGAATLYSLQSTYSGSSYLV